MNCPRLGVLFWNSIKFFEFYAYLPGLRGLTLHKARLQSLLGIPTASGSSAFQDYDNIYISFKNLALKFTVVPCDFLLILSDSI